MSLIEALGTKLYHMLFIILALALVFFLLHQLSKRARRRLEEQKEEIFARLEKSVKKKTGKQGE
ncbi:MAG: hypothetical protein J7L64_03425 [Acidobacteria bacterium]|nr:hypothetical protein [Acidobacteriota bacterium]